MEFFSIIPDTRIDRNKKHRLLDIIVIAVLGTLAGCEGWVEIEDYGRNKIEWLKQFLDLSNGIPSHDTFGRVFSILSPELFQEAFWSWMNSLSEISGLSKIISIDGKYLRGSLQESRRPRSAIAIVSAWATEAGLCIGQTKSEAKKELGEKRATEDLIDKLFLEGCIVTLDANGATPRITEKIVTKKGDYMIGLKSNQKSLLRYAGKAFEGAEETGCFKTETKYHGRIEVREYYQLDINNISFGPSLEVGWKNLVKKWPHLNSFVMVKSQRQNGEIKSEETRYYISSAAGNVEEAARVVRSHWGIENSLHWVLDVVFKEDHSQVRMGHAAENLALLRRMTLNMLKKAKTPKTSFRRMRLKCGWDDQYLKEVLGAQL